MNLACAISLWLAVPAQAGGPEDARKPTEPTRFWYGNPLKQMPSQEIQKDYPRAALATLSAKELAALEKLKAIGLTVVPSEQFRSVTKEGKVVVVPPSACLTTRDAGIGVSPYLATTGDADF